MAALTARFKVRLQLNFKEVINKERKASERALFRAGGFVRTAARRSIRKKKASSLPGMVPTFRSTDSKVYKGQYISNKRAKIIEERGGVVTIRKGQGGALRRSIGFAVNKRKLSVVIGPDRFNIGPVGNVLEHGGTLRGRKYKARPFMQPQLDKIARTKLLPAFWRNLLIA